MRESVRVGYNSLGAVVILAGVLAAGSAVACSGAPGNKCGARAQQQQYYDFDGQSGRFQLADSDGDGLITRTEALSHALVRFHAADANHDHRVSSLEYLRFSHDGVLIPAMGVGTPPPDQEAFEAAMAVQFQRYDLNRDGGISPGEWLESGLVAFAAADDDGAVSVWRYRATVAP